jgi:hypothetical protein
MPRILNNQRLETFMKRSAVLSVWTAACAFIAIQSLCIYANAPLRRPVSADKPLILVDAGSMEPYFLDTWNDIPDDLKPYCGLLRWPGGSNSETESIISECDQNGIWCMIEAGMCNSSIFDCDGSFAASMFDKYPHFLGYEWGECLWNHFSQWTCANQQIQVCADKGGLFMMADFAGDIWNNIGSRADFMNFCRSSKDNVVVLDKTTNGGNYYWNESACMGYWLAGYVGNWGLSADNWLWSCEDGPTQYNTCQGNEIGRAHV